MGMGADPADELGHDDESIGVAASALPRFHSPRPPGGRLPRYPRDHASRTQPGPRTQA